MKKIFINIITIAFAAATITGCKKSFDELNNNPNKPTSAPASLLFNGIVNDIFEEPYSMKERWCQYFCCNYDYYGNNRYDFGSGDNYYSTLKNIVKMKEEAINAGAAEVNPYSALAKFFEAYLYSKMSFEMGDLPLSEAEQGISNLTPVYDDQKSIFVKCFSWLDSANNELTSLVSEGASLSGDIYLNNDLAKWQKVVNTYRLRLLIDMSNKVSDNDLNVKAQFAQIVGNPTKYPVMESADDNLQYTFTHPTNDYPMNPDNYGFDGLRYNMSDTYLGLLTGLKDPRTFVVSEPASAQVKAGVSPTSFDAFVGANPGEDLGIMFNKAGAGVYSQINRYHFYQTYTAEPSIQVGYPELCFIIAEAINRGWVSGDAEAYYKKGIDASMEFYNIPSSGSMTTYVYVSGSPGSSDVKYNTYTVTVNLDAYYNQSDVKYAGNNSTGLTQILLQKYLALFRHSGLESYYTYRRTGIPTFQTGPATGNSGRIPVRFQYPSSERTANTDNYEAALSSQYDGNDDINAKMWLLK